MNSLEVFLREIGIEPVVLHRQADEGLTIIEKFERHSDVGFAFILATPDDVAFLQADFKDNGVSADIEHRARQNVIFEWGYFVAKLGRGRTCCIYKEGVTLPSDLSGLIYKQVEDNVEERGYEIIKELKAAGLCPTV
jgi:predicted nucleotide-binding protein